MNSEMAPMILLLAIAIVAGIVLLIFIGRAQTTKTLNTVWYKEQWQGIAAQAEDGSAGRQLAIINADKLLDRAMRERGFKGERMGERLTKHPKSFSKLNDVWAAHKLRNRIAHESNINVSEAETQKALKGLERGLKDLGALS